MTPVETPVRTYWLEPTDQVAIGLRRYAHDFDPGHHALVYLEIVDAVYDDQGYISRREETPHDDPRWPATCTDEGCGYEFLEEDHWQDWQERVWRRTDTGELRVLHPSASAAVLGAPSAEPGACWDATWLPFSKGPDGMTLIVRCPDWHDWTVDSRASNCGSPDDDEHRCWVRHGDPRECRVTVDKNGNTCTAGAGSIQTPDWHGFLREGWLVT